MSNYNENKKVHRITAVIYIIVMAFIVVGTIISEDHKVAAKSTAQEIWLP